MCVPEGQMKVVEGSLVLAAPPPEPQSPLNHDGSAAGHAYSDAPPTCIHTRYKLNNLIRVRI